MTQNNTICIDVQQPGTPYLSASKERILSQYRQGQRATFYFAQRKSREIYDIPLVRPS